MQPSWTDSLVLLEAERTPKNLVVFSSILGAQIGVINAEGRTEWHNPGLAEWWNVCIYVDMRWGHTLFRFQVCLSFGLLKPRLRTR